MESPVLEAIHRRRSIRAYSEDPVPPEILRRIIEAGIWAPSGLNNQPWRFVTIQRKALRDQLAELTRYGHIVRAAPALIAVFLDREDMYDEVKDHQAAGACIQNMLLAVEAFGLGAVWLGQILTNKERVNEALGLDKRHDLMAVIAIGHPKDHDQKSRRKTLSHFILKEFQEEP